MSRFFDLDSPFISGLNKFADLMILNLITFVFCIPIVTIGASMTAMHFVTLKIVRNEESYIFKTFWRSFKQNFRQATIIWLIEVVLILFFTYDFWIIRRSGIDFPQWVVIGMLIVTVLLVAVCIYVYPILSKFENSIAKTIKNSFLISLLIWPKTLIMIVVWMIPIIIMFFFPQVLPIDFLFGFTGPAFVSALLYNKTFKRFEPKEEEVDADAWSLESLEGEGAEETEEEITEISETDNSEKEVTD